MDRRRRAIAFLVFAFLVLGFYRSALTQTREESQPTGWESTPKTQKQDSQDIDQAVRSARGGKFNNPYAPPIDADQSQISKKDPRVKTGRVIGEPISASSMPVCIASDIFVGTFIDSQPFLSNDHSTIYSEIYVRVDDALKTRSPAPLSTGKVVTALLPGGTIVLEDGRKLSQHGPVKSRLQPGRTYLFFAQYSKATKSYDFINLWDLSTGTVTAVSHADVDASEKGRSPHSGKRKESFLQEVRDSLQNCSGK
jgi:hypothetical protein